MFTAFKVPSQWSNDYDDFPIHKTRKIKDFLKRDKYESTLISHCPESCSVKQNVSLMGADCLVKRGSFASSEGSGCLGVA